MRDGAAQDMRRLAWLLDEFIRLPGGRRIGLDGIIGLIPGLGDAAGFAASAYILWRSRHFGIPPVVIARMIGNVLLDSVVGVIPVLGDLFDLGFKANRRNIALVEQYLVNERKTRKSSWIRVILAAGIMLAAIVLFLYLAFSLIQWIGQLIAA